MTIEMLSLQQLSETLSQQARQSFNRALWNQSRQLVIWQAMKQTAL